MNGNCPCQSELDAWQRLGAQAALPEALEQHVSQCLPCRARVSEISALRGLFANLPALEIEQRRLDEMRFLLMAESRRKPERQQPIPEALPYRRWRRWQPLFGYVAGIALFVSAASALSSVRARWGEERGAREASTAPRASHPQTTVAVFPNAVSPNPDLGGTLPPPVPSLNPPPSSEAALAHGQQATPGAAGRLRRKPPAASEAAEAALPAEASIAASRAAALSTDAQSAAALSADARFRRARALLSQGRAPEAISAFDGLADDPSVDAARRADALFWSARASRASGDGAGARLRAERYVVTYPDGWYATRAAALR